MPKASTSTTLLKAIGPPQSSTILPTDPPPTVQRRSRSQTKKANDEDFEEFYNNTIVPRNVPNIVAEIPPTAEETINVSSNVSSNVCSGGVVDSSSTLQKSIVKATTPAIKGITFSPKFCLIQYFIKFKFFMFI